jgi:hypothetical protein
MRGGREQTLSVALETAPEMPRDELVLTTRSPFLGAKIWNLSPALSEELRIDPYSDGVIIADVIPGSPAQSYGFQRGDIESWSRLSEQNLRVDKWSACRG